MEGTQCLSPMPRYVCHKVVRALKIKSIELDIDKANKENRETDGSAVLNVGDGFAPVKVGYYFVQKISEDRGDDCGYYVVYEDGYKSWSPTEAFEKGYTRV